MPRSTPTPPAPIETSDPAYAERLLRLGNVWWKRLLDVQRPYRWHLQRLDLGFVLDLGCGIGRNLRHLKGNGVGIDHSIDAIALCKERGLNAFTPEDFKQSEFASPGRFDSLLVAHVIEHMTGKKARELLREYLPYVRQNGRVVLIVPQEQGQQSDPTHREFVSLAGLHLLARNLGLVPEKAYSFPFPRPAGHLFAHNESVVIARNVIAG